MRADAQRNAEHLVATAREVFAERGLDAPLDDIAKAAGLGSGTLYRHFANRDELVEAVYRDQVAKLAHRADELLAKYPNEPLRALETWMRAQVKFVSQQRGLGVRLKAMVDPNGEAMRWCKDTLREAAEKLLAAAAPAGIRPDIAPYDLLRIGHGIGLATETSSPKDAERLVGLMLCGLLVPAAAQ
jgi:AcrR family transcriptional regulator